MAAGAGGVIFCPTLCISSASAVENTSGLQVAGVNVTVAGVTFQK